MPALAATSDFALRVGFVPLTDAAPLVAAQELGLFHRHGLSVRLHREVGWATLRDKLSYGELDAAHALAPLLWSIQLGLDCGQADVCTALVLNLHGNAITLSRRLYEAGIRDAGALRAEARRRKGENRLTFGIVSTFSSHHLQLRQWLQAAQLDPVRDVRIAVVPPAQMFRNLAAGTLDGYRAGEPWNSLAVQSGAGWCPAWSSTLAPGHLEKVLLVRRDFTTRQPGAHAALVRALVEAAAWCDEPANRRPLATMLALPGYLNQPVSVLTPALTGRFKCAPGQTATIPDFHIFHRGHANVPTPARAAALQADLIAAGLVPAAAIYPELPRHLFRDDLHRDAINHTDADHDPFPPSLRGGVLALQP